MTNVRKGRKGKFNDKLCANVVCIGSAAGDAQSNQGAALATEVVFYCRIGQPASGVACGELAVDILLCLCLCLATTSTYELMFIDLLRGFWCFLATDGLIEVG